MKTSMAGPSGAAAHNKSKSRGRPAYRTDSTGVRDMRRLLAVWHYLEAPSSVSGNRPTLRAMAYGAWALDHLTTWNFGRRTPPPLATPAELIRVRADAVRVVREKLARPHFSDPLIGRAGSLEDVAAVSEEVASRYSRSGPDQVAVRRVERHMERVITEAQSFEYRHVGKEALTGRRALPPS